MKKVVMLVNTNNLLSYFEHYDLMQYSINISGKTDDFEDIELLIEDDSFDSTDIMDDILLRSIFTGNDSYIANLSESLNLNVFGISVIFLKAIRIAIMQAPTPRLSETR